MLKNFFLQLKKRNVFKWLALHVSTSLTVLFFLDFVASTYNFSPIILDLVVLLSLCGFPAVATLAWFHGEEGPQKTKATEVVIYLLVFSAFIYFATKRISSQPAPIKTVANSIAVLPFQNFSNSKSDEYFSDGVTEDILTELSKIGQLKVVSRTSVLKYKHTTKSIREIARELGVANILEGSVRRSGDSVRIVAQLIDAKHDNHLWAQTYDRKMKDIFQIQSDVAQKIASQLEAKLTDKEKKRINRQSTANVNAYTLYLKGKEYYYLYSKENNATAGDFFKSAIKLDSNYALAYCGLADAYAQRFGYFDMGKAWLDSSRAMSKKALSLDPDIAEPYKSLGVSYFYVGKEREAINYYLKAIDINPNLAVAISNLGAAYWAIGNYPEAKKWIEKAIPLEVNRAFNYRMMGLLYFGLCNYDKAEKYLLKVRDLQPELTFAISDLTKVYAVTNQLDKARKLLDRYYKKKPNDHRILSALGDLELYSGNEKKAQEYYQKSVDVSSLESGSAVELAFLLSKKKKSKADKIFSKLIEINSTAISNGSEDFNYPYDLSRIYSAKMNKQKSLKYMQMAINDGFRFYQLAEIDPIFTYVKNDSAFIKQMTELKAMVDSMAAQIKGH